MSCSVNKSAKYSECVRMDCMVHSKTLGPHFSGRKSLETLRCTLKDSKANERLFNAALVLLAGDL